MNPPFSLRRRFCTACGAGNDSDALYCEQCGLFLKPLRMALGVPAVAPEPQARRPEAVAQPVPGGSMWPQPTAQQPIARQPAPQQPSPQQQPPSPQRPTGLVDAPRVPWGQRWLAPAAALASVLVLLLGLVIWQAGAPPPSGAEVLQAAKSSAQPIAVPSSDLLCFNNLPYHRHHIQVTPTDQITRRWLDALVQAGLYAPGVQVVAEGLSGNTLVQYQGQPALQAWRRSGRLCVAQAWSLEAVQPGSTRKVSADGQARYMVSLVWRAQGVAPWFSQLPEAGKRLPGVALEGGALTTTTVALVVWNAGRWEMAPLK